MAVAVSVHSNMWGKYEDVLVSECEGLPPAQLPLALGVTGLPLRLANPTPNPTPTPTPTPNLPPLSLFPRLLLLTPQQQLRPLRQCREVVVPKRSGALAVRTHRGIATYVC